MKPSERTNTRFEQQEELQQIQELQRQSHETDLLGHDKAVEDHDSLGVDVERRQQVRERPLHRDEAAGVSNEAETRSSRLASKNKQTGGRGQSLPFM